MASPTPSMPAEPSVVVGIATRGRPGVLAAVVRHLERQTLRPRALVVTCPSLEDVGEVAGFPGVDVRVAPPGLTRQRNAILEAVPAGTDIVVFFDDDFVADGNWIRACADFLAREPDAACVTGRVIADGIKGPGLSFDEACRAIAADAGPTRSVEWGYSPYGCNMAFRWSAVGARRFDERLVLYGWLEDRDFGSALLNAGWRQARIGAARGVHMGVKLGRIAGTRLGYSQVVNPVYMSRKGTMAAGAVLRHVGRNLAANIAGSIRPEPYIDRRGRLRGNVIGLLDLLRGRLKPERAEVL